MKSALHTLITVVLLSVAQSGVAAEHGARWSDYPRQRNVGAFGIVLADLQGNGNLRVVASVRGSQASALVVYEGGAGSMAFRQLLQLDPNQAIHGELLSYRPALGEPERIGIAIGGEFVSFGGWPLRRLGAVPLPSSTAQVSSIYDIDNDGALELLGYSQIVAGFPGVPFVVSAADGTLLWEDPALEVQDIAAGHVGTMTDPVIILSHRSINEPGLVLSGPTRQPIWSWPDGFNGKIRIGNYAGDSATEFALISTWGDTVIFRASPSFTPIAQFPTGEASARASVDLDGDGYDEIVVGEGQWGSVIGFDARTGAEVFEISNPVHGVRGLAVGRLGSDSALSLVHGGGLSSSSVDILRVVDVATATVSDLWEEEIGPYSASSLLRLADGSTRIAFATTRSRTGIQGSAIYLLDPQSGARVNAVLPADAFQAREELQLLSANLDTDAQDELIAYSTDDGMGYVAARDGQTLQLQWQLSMPSGDAAQDVAVVDVDGDGALDVVVAARGRLHFIDGLNGNIVWTSEQFPFFSESKLGSGPLLSNGNPGIAYTQGAQMLIIDPISRTVDRSMPMGWDLIDQDVHVDGQQCEHRLYYADRIERHHCRNGITEQVRMLAVTATMVRIPGAFDDELLLSDGRRLLLQENDQIIRQSAHIDGLLGHGNRGVVLSQEHGWQVYVGGDFGFHRVDFGPEIFVDGFEFP